MPHNPDCRLCPLWEGARHVCVPGMYRHIESATRHTPENARVMIVGEGPGYNEDAQNLPFVGAAGAKLNEIQAEIGLDVTFVTNSQRCYPEANGRRKTAAMLQASIKACAPYLEEEIAEVRPTHILALGAPALHRLGVKGSITDMAGKEVWSERYRCWVMGALHPAYILRVPGKEQSWKADLHHFAHLVAGDIAHLPQLAPHVAKTALDVGIIVRKMWAAKEMGTPFTFDFEATPIPWWHKDWRPYSIGFCFDGKTAYVLPLDHPESKIAGDLQSEFFATVREYMQDPTIAKTAHNDLYDAPAWYRIAGYYPYTTCDTMVLAHLLDENRPKSLKWLGRSLLGWPDWDIDATKEHPLEELALYNSYDALATYQLRDTLLADLRARPDLDRYFRLVDMPKVRSVGRMMVNGVYIDRDVLAERIEECCGFIQKTASTIPVANPNSSQQIAQWLYSATSETPADSSSVESSTRGLGLSVISSTPGGRPSTDEATINTLMLLHPEHPELKKILEYRKWKKYETTYLAYADEIVSTSWDSRAHFEYRSTSVETGRLGSRFHTMPRDPFVRSIVSAPKGWTIFSADYSQIEARIAAWWAAGKPTSLDSLNPSTGTSSANEMLCAFRDNRDVYKETAAAALHKPYNAITGDERQMMGKVPSLAMIYRISAEGFREYAWNQFEVIYTKAEAEKLHRAFYARWPEIKRWHESESELLKARGFAHNPLGRIRHLPEMDSPDRGIVEAAVRSGINAPIQGMASDCLQIAHSKLLRDIEIDDWDVRIVGNVHDALLFEVRNDALHGWAENVCITMEYEVPSMLAALGVQFPAGLLKVEGQLGPWGKPYATFTHENIPPTLPPTTLS